MSVKHVEKYYEQIRSQYKEMIQDIQDLEVEATQGLVEPERIDRLKEQVAPIKDNYERWSYMMFLLHTPNRKAKQKGYSKRNQKLLQTLSSTNSIEAVIEENKKSLAIIGE